VLALAEIFFYDISSQTEMRQTLSPPNTGLLVWVQLNIVKRKV